MKYFYVKLFALLFLCLLFVPFQVLASSSCTAPVTTDIGYEYAAFNCPVEGDDENTRRWYEYVSIKCVGGTIQTGLVYVPITAGQFKESEIITFAKQNDNYTRILTNESKTHVIAIYKAWSGVSIEGISASVGTTENVVFNKICTPDVGGMPDSDGDDFPDCLDCDPEDETIGYGCIPCKTEIEAQCGSTDNALNWRDDPEKGCIGTCKDKNLGNCP